MATWRERQAKKLEAKPVVEVNEITFPSLNTQDGWSEERTKKQEYKKSFASLAKDWSESAEIEKQRATLQEEKRKIEEAELEMFRKLRYRREYEHGLGTSHARDEDTYYDNNDEEDYQTADTSDDWRTVSKKIRKPVRNVLFREPPQEEPESVWTGVDQDE